MQRRQISGSLYDLDHIYISFHISGIKPTILNWVISKGNIYIDAKEGDLGYKLYTVRLSS